MPNVFTSALSAQMNLTVFFDGITYIWLEYALFQLLLLVYLIDNKSTDKEYVMCTLALLC